MTNNRRRLVGRVVSDKMDKTVVVAIDVRKMHPIYKKVVRETKKLYARDETNSVPMGAVVRVVESRPYSKTVRWVVEEVIEAKDFASIDQMAVEASVAGVIAPEAEVEVEADVTPEAETAAHADTAADEESEAAS
jgi:small subunit ribosomal protein S17